MSIQQPTSVQVANAEDIDALLNRFPDLAGENVVLTVPDESNVLLTAAEFSRLLSRARESRVKLSISTQDRLRQELARMLGWTVVDSPLPPPDAPTLINEAEMIVSDGFGWRPTERPPEGYTRPGKKPAQHSTADLATYVPDRAIGPRAPEPDVSKEQLKPSASVIGAPEVQLPPKPVVTREPKQPATQVGSGPSKGETTDSKLLGKPSWRRRSVLAGAVAAPVLVLVVVGALLAYLLPTATVSLVPTESTISSTLTYGLAGTGNSYDISIEPSEAQYVATFDMSIPTTGERFVPDGVATGSVLFTNPLTQVVTIPGNTELQGTNGQSYYTQSAIQIPAADPFGSLSFGSASVNIAAGTAGPDANAEAGTVAGQLNNGIFFTNREPITGGTMQRIAVVSESDVAALQEAATSDLQARAQQEFLNSLSPGTEVMPDSLSVGEVDLHFSHAAGEDSAELFVKGFLGVAAQVYDPEVLHEQALNEAGRRLAAQAGPEVMILGDTVRISEPIPVNEDGTSYEIQAYAEVRSVITDQQREELASNLSGQSLEDAEARIAGMPNVAEYNIDLEPTWLPDRMPEILSRIDVVVTSDDRASSWR